MDGGLTPAKVPNAVISEIRDREVDGLVQLVQPDQLQPGDPVRIARGPLMGQLGIYAGMSSAQRVQVLFMLLAGQRKVTLALDDIESATL
jgi:transcription antitermination factor NusG